MDTPTKTLLLITILGWGVCAVFQKLAVRFMPPIACQLSSAISLTIFVIAYFYIATNNARVEFDARGIIWASLAALASGIGSVAFMSLIKTRDVGEVVAYTSCNPVVTFLVAAIFLGEAITASRIIGIVFVLLGILFLKR